MFASPQDPSRGFHKIGSVFLLLPTIHMGLTVYPKSILNASSLSVSFLYSWHVLAVWGKHLTHPSLYTFLQRSLPPLRRLPSGGVWSWSCTAHSKASRFCGSGQEFMTAFKPTNFIQFHLFKFLLIVIRSFAIIWNHVLDLPAHSIS